MSGLSYSEIVTLLVPYEEPRTLTFSDAVFHTCPDRREIIGSSGAGHVSSEGFSVFAARQLG